jgi:hypothetical protein
MESDDRACFLLCISLPHLNRCLCVLEFRSFPYSSHEGADGPAGADQAPSLVDEVYGLFAETPELGLLAKKTGFANNGQIEDLAKVGPSACLLFLFFSLMFLWSLLSIHCQKSKELFAFYIHLRLPLPFLTSFTIGRSTSLCISRFIFKNHTFWSI